MSADLPFFRHVCGASLAALGLAIWPAMAAEDPLPDAAFLEYLGTWEGTDEDWLLFEDAARDRAAGTDEEQSDSPDESPELKDEH